MTSQLSLRWLRLCPTTWPGKFAATKKAPSCSSSHRTTTRLMISLMLWASLLTTFLLLCTNFTSLWSINSNFSPPLSQNSHAQITKANRTLLSWKTLPSTRSTPKSATTPPSIKTWSGGPPLKQLSRSPLTFPRVSPPTALSPTQSRLSALVG